MSQVKKQFRFTIAIDGKPRGIMVMGFNYADAVAQLQRMYPNAVILDSY